MLPKSSKKISTSYFPVWAKATGSVLIIFFLVYSFTLFSIGICLIVAVLLFDTIYVTKIDLAARQYEDYLSIFGMKTQYEHATFESPDKIIITMKQVTHGYRGRAIHRDTSWSEYTATIIFTNGNILDLIVENKKDSLLKKVKDLALFCNVTVEDRTGAPWNVIDLSTVN